MPSYDDQGNDLLHSKGVSFCLKTVVLYFTPENGKVRKHSVAEVGRVDLIIIIKIILKIIFAVVQHLRSLQPFRIFKLCAVDFYPMSVVLMNPKPRYLAIILL